MKASTKLLTSLLLVLLTATIFIDILLQKAYSKINLADPFKSYQPVAIKPFRYLIIKGGNGYAIEIKQATQLDMKVMNTRKNFLSVRQSGDTLLLSFTVPSGQSMRDPENIPLGIIITSPQIRSIIADGTNNILTSWKTDSLDLKLMGNATININGADIGNLTAQGNQNVIFNFHSATKVEHLDIRLSNNAAAFLKEISYLNLNPQLTQNSQLVFGAKTAAKLYLK